MTLALQKLTMARPSIRWSIGSLITLAVVSVVAVSIAVFTVLDIQRERSRAFESLEQRAALLSSPKEHTFERSWQK